MEVTFWGVRGSIASSSPHIARTGGNTPCVEVTSGNTRLIFDSGTGIRPLGDALLEAGNPIDVTLFFSHLHWDHVQGFPFFAPAFASNTRLQLFGPGANGAEALHNVLARQMEPPTFPVPLSTMRSQMKFCDAIPSQPIEFGPFIITPFEAPHPNGCLGYRVEADGQRFVYMTDVEISLQTLTTGISRIIAGADMLVLDAQYTPQEYNGIGTHARKGWGHSTCTDAAEIALHMGVKRLFLFHHDPAHTDVFVEQMAVIARDIFAASEPARERSCINLSEVASGAQ